MKPTVPVRTARVFALVILVLTLSVATASPAFADAAGPTDYRTDILAVEPASAAIAVEMIGGDSFVRLEQLAPVEVVVNGYQGEPYLRFAADGSVFENRRSPATWLNQERYGTEELPPIADADAPPEWVEVGGGGSYAWHDHRSHWMNEKRPPGARAGDQVLEATIPLEVDGTAVTITVASYLLAGPNRAPVVLGGALAAAAGVAALRQGRLASLVPGAVVTALAAVLGVVAYRSVPSETGPSVLLWVLPVASLAAMLLAFGLRRRLTTTVYLDGLATVAGGLLMYWGITRFDALARALIPSDAPAWLDRFTIAASLAAGAVAVAQGLFGLATPKRLGA